MADTYTYQDFQREYNLSEEDVKLTLNAIGFHANKKKFNQDEQKLFAEARDLLNSDDVASYEQLTEHFKTKNIDREKMDSDPSNHANLSTKIKQDAVETGFQIGILQGDIMAEVIPKAAMYRLQEKITKGELRESFHQLWTETMGKSDNLEMMIQQRFKSSPLEASPSPTNLLTSSMESSESESE